MDILPAPKLPKRIGGLTELAYNLWWSWHAEARGLFKGLDHFLWKATGHNPVKMLQQIAPCRLVAAAENPDFLKKYDSVMSDFKSDILGSDSWISTKYPHLGQGAIAYFSPEFAIHNSIPIYAGGLGILAGDYCKEASDLGLPMVGVGFMYPKGYFRQRISSDGWQEEVYEHLNFDEAPVSVVTNAERQRVIVEVPFDGKSVHVAVWQVNVGRVKLYLLDTDIEQNSSVDRQLSACLYTGDREMRLQQEIVLGIGGPRVLQALDIEPSIWHANEGHVAFMMLERVRALMDKSMDFIEAADKVRDTTVFTTHTPVPAGNDTFSLELVQKYLCSYFESYGLSRDVFLELGVQDTDNSVFNMTVLGLRMANHCNGVSQLHGMVCRRMWHNIWPDIEEEDVPIGSITNGVHIPSWVAPQMAKLYHKYIGPDWLDEHDDPSMWERVIDIPDEEIWYAHRFQKNKLITLMQNRARKRWCGDNAKSVQALAMGGLFDPDVLTIGFSRRFTEYKRAALILSDVDRLKRLLLSDLQPLQIVFAGKAHPSDVTGKHLIREVYNMATDPQFGARIAFVEDYDMHVARYLVQGVDVWLNTPRLLQEASGTSGQKAALNGVPQLSILDGWWYEGYNGANGWAIHQDIGILDSTDMDKADADELYNLLEEKVVPLYYDRDIGGTPHGWVRLIKETIRSNVPLFSARRMTKEYTEQMYLPAYQASQGSMTRLASVSNVKNHSSKALPASVSSTPST